MQRSKLRLILAACAFLSTSPAVAEKPDKRLLRLELDGRKLEGISLYWSDIDAVLLGRDGRMWFFEPRHAQGVRRTGDVFQPFSSARMKSELAREFGRRFEVTSTGHYLVVHPRGKGDAWCRRFEELYRSFRHFFAVRGLEVKQPPFPLVAVVLPSQRDFHRYTQRDLGAPRPGVLGYYSPTTNRVAMYDVAGDEADWSVGDAQNAETIIHEATHQTAFNTGIHNRLRPPPRWLAEGLGTLFEARGVWDSRHNARSRDRINEHQLAAFRAWRDRRPADAVARLTADDRLFETDVAGAYAEAWALTYFLIETQPRMYAKYLERTAKGKPFRDYTSTARRAHFAEIFGEDLAAFNARFLRFMESL